MNLLKVSWRIEETLQTFVVDSCLTIVIVPEVDTYFEQNIGGKGEACVFFFFFPFCFLNMLPAVRWVL